MKKKHGVRVLAEEKVANRIAEMRIKKGLTQVELAEAAEISRSTVQKIERLRTSPTVRQLLGIANALECKAVEFLAD